MSLTLIAHQDNEWSLSGPLNAHTIKRIWRKGHQFIAQAKGLDIILNLSQLTEPDSASVALLLDWLRYAKRHHKTLHLQQIPQKMQEIIRLSNLQDILMIKLN